MGLLKTRPKQPVSLCKSIVMGGEAGEGIKSAGKIIALSLMKTGNDVFVYDEYPSLIRGGHNSVNITYSPAVVYATNREIDILICLNRETFDLHKKNLNQGSIVLYDRKDFEISDQDLVDCPCELIDIPVSDILKKKKLPRITQNMIMVAAALCTAGVLKETLLKTIKKEFSKKSDEILEHNNTAVEEGYDNALEFSGIKSFDKADKKGKLPRRKKKGYFITGNDSLVLGAIQSGIQFFAAYPMTPASTILDAMMANYREFDFIVKQTEDEIAAINMAIGAAFAGARSMVGTSGGGFSLMVEGLGLAAITETPIVIALVQRPGPATGLPTWTGQADLMFALHASQDEFPRIILTPTDIDECFHLSFMAFNLAEKYQLPVIILSDKYIAESMQTINLNPALSNTIDRGMLMSNRMLARIADFHRYEITSNGISPRSIPGQKNGVYIANSDESDSKGFSSEDAANRAAKMDKRFRKVEHIMQDLPELDVYGDIKAKNCFVTWGGSKGAILEAMRRLQSIGVSSKLLALNYIEPFPTEEVEKFIKGSKKVMLVESNFSGQLGKLITMNTGFEFDYKLLKYDGRPLFPDEIVNFALQESNK
jgi:2-oxoglutarate/2-oxoacid ferredoxin oxidoreductase subunit alpha